MIAPIDIHILVKEGKIDEVIKLGTDAVGGLLHFSCPGYKGNTDCINVLITLGRTNEECFKLLLDELTLTDQKVTKLTRLTNELGYTETLNNMEAELRAVCAKVLGMINDPRAIKSLLIGLKDNAVTVRAACITALLEMIRSDPINRLAIESNDKMLEGIVAGLKDNSNYVKGNCLYLLDDLILMSPDVIKKLSNILKDKILEEILYSFGIKWEELVKQISILMTARIAKMDYATFKLVHDELAVESIEYLAKRKVCAEVIRELKDPRSTDLILALLKLGKIEGYDPVVCQICIDTLGEIAKTDERTFKLLVKELVNAAAREDSRFALCCINALGITKDPRATNALLIWLGYYDQFSSGQLYCKNALKNINDPQAIRFIQIIADKNKSYAKKIGLEKTLETIMGYLELIKNYYPEKRMNVIKSGLIRFYMEVAKELNESKVKMNLDLPKGMLKSPKDNGINRRIKRAVL